MPAKKPFKRTQTWRMPVRWFHSAPVTDLMYEINRLHSKLVDRVPKTGAEFDQIRRGALLKIQEERSNKSQKEVAINNLLDRADAVTKARVAPLLRGLPLKRLCKANPYAGNASDDCHTFS